jgi:RHS repeat-associated protein
MLFRFTGPNTADLADRYLWAPVIDMLLSDEKLTAPDQPGDVYWALGDNLNTIRDIARYDPETDTTCIVNHRVFDAFGNVTSETNAAVDLLFAFTGRLFDDATGLQNNLHRWYDPTIGRWLSEDPIGFAANDANLYRYVGNAPTARTDSSGLQDDDDPRNPWRRAPNEIVQERDDVRFITVERDIFRRKFVDGHEGIWQVHQHGRFKIVTKQYWIIQRERRYTSGYMAYAEILQSSAERARRAAADADVASNHSMWQAFLTGVGGLLRQPQTVGIGLIITLSTNLRARSANNLVREALSAAGGAAEEMRVLENQGMMYEYRRVRGDLMRREQQPVGEWTDVWEKLMIGGPPQRPVPPGGPGAPQRPVPGAGSGGTWSGGG